MPASCAKDGEVLGLVLKFAEDFSPQEKVNLVNSMAVFMIAGHHDDTEILELIFEFFKDLSPQEKVNLVDSNAIEVAILNNKTEILKSLLVFSEDFPHENKINLITKIVLTRSIGGGRIECRKLLLDFLVENNITQIEGVESLWTYYINRGCLETKDVYKLWQLTKDSYQKMDEVNNKLLANKELGVKFVTDICSFMIQNGKEIDIDIIRFPDIVKLLSGEKDGYKHKIFQDMASLNEAEPADKVKAAKLVF